MTSQKPIIWLALSAFDDPMRMGQALTGLHACDIGLDEMCVAGNPSAIGGMQLAIGGAHAWQHFVPLFAGVEPVPFIPIVGGFVATTGRLMTTSPAANGAESQRECLIPPAQRLRLAGLVETGAVLLVANPSTQEKWTKSTRVLLQNSTHPVQSHEIAAPFSLTPPGTRIP